MAKKEKEAPESPEPPAGQVEQAADTAGAEVGPTEELSKDTRMWAMFCHLAGLAGIVMPVVGNIVAPLIIWQIKKEGLPFVDENGKEALNFQISLSLYAVVGSVVCLITCVGAILVPFLIGAAYIFGLIFLLIAGIKANNGESYRYPLCIRFIK